jgi:hypothetical protein
VPTVACTVFFEEAEWIALTEGVKSFV